MLNVVDKWLLARLLQGYSLSLVPVPGLSDQGRIISEQIGAVHYKDRELLLRRMLPASVITQILKIDPPDHPPRLEDLPYVIFRADDLNKLPPLSWLVPGEIVERGICLLYGESGVGKSFISLDYAMRIADSGASVVYAPTEGESGYRKRVEAWKHHHRKASLPNLYFVFGGVALHDDKLMSSLLPDLKRIAPRLLVIDTLSMGMVGLDENNARDVGSFMSICRQTIRRLECAILLVHHTSKGGVVERGSTALRGQADTMIRVVNADDLVQIECSKTKDDAPFPTRYMKLLPALDSLVPVPAERVIRAKDDPLTPNQQRVLSALALEVNRDGVSLRDLSESVGLSIGAIQRAVSNLMFKGLTEKSVKGNTVISNEGLALINHAESGESGESVNHAAPAARERPVLFRDSADSPIQSPFPNLPKASSTSTPHWKT
jgi:archaellum biogenesis ATPase FlaH